MSVLWYIGRFVQIPRYTRVLNRRDVFVDRDKVAVDDQPGHDIVRVPLEPADERFERRLPRPSVKKIARSVAIHDRLVDPVESLLAASSLRRSADPLYRKTDCSQHCS